MPHVSVIIPTYNRKIYLQEAINSVLAQSHRHHEILVVDDGSTDGTDDALQARYGDRIRYVWQENQGESAARNRGIEMARGTYVAFLDSDDLWQPEFLANLVAALEARPEAVLACCQAWLIDESGQRLDSTVLNSGLQEEDLSLAALCLRNTVGPPSATLVRREKLEPAGGFDPAIRYGEDWDLWLRLRQEGPFVFLPEPLASVRAHRGSQCHYPRPETVDQRLRDYLRLLDKVFERWREAPVGLHERAVACQYADIAFSNYAIGRAASGRERLEEAARLDPQFYGDFPHLSEWLVNRLLSTAWVSREAVSDTVRKAEMAVGHWSANLPVPRQWKSRTLGSLCASLAFERYRADDPAGTRYCVAQAIRYDRSWLRDAGIWSIGAESFLGRAAADRLRSGFRRAVPRSPAGVPDSTPRSQSPLPGV